MSSFDIRSQRSFNSAVRTITDNLGGGKANQRSAKFIVWHASGIISKPRKAPKYHIPIVTQYDQLTCNYCLEVLDVPLETGRFHENTYRAQREVYYSPSAPQRCSCGNLATITDHQGRLQVYLMDKDSSAFSMSHSSINLLANSIERKDPLEVPLHSMSTPPLSPYSHHSRSTLQGAFVNLYKLPDKIRYLLLPINNLSTYARAYNVVVYGRKHLYTPSGHSLPYRTYPLPKELDKLLQDPRMDSSKSARIDLLTQKVLHTTLMRHVESQKVPKLLQHLPVPTITKRPPNLTWGPRTSPRVHYKLPWSPFVSLQYRIDLCPLSQYHQTSILNLSSYIKGLSIPARRDLQDYTQHPITPPRRLSPPLAPPHIPHQQRYTRTLTSNLEWMYPRFTPGSLVSHIQYLQDTSPPIPHPQHYITPPNILLIL